jgi:hypothetical protein
MAMYDIINIEDAPGTRKEYEEAAKKHGLSYYAFDNYGDLEKNIDKVEAKVWLVDSLFPRERGRHVEFIGMKAIRLIKKKHPKAKIAISTVVDDSSNRFNILKKFSDGNCCFILDKLDEDEKVMREIEAIIES